MEFYWTMFDVITWIGGMGEEVVCGLDAVEKWDQLMSGN